MIKQESTQIISPFIFKNSIIQDLGLQKIWTEDNAELHDLDNLIVEFLNCANSVWEEGLVELPTFKPMLVNTPETLPVIQPLIIAKEQRH